MKKEVLVGILGLLVLIGSIWGYLKIRKSGVLGRHFTLRISADYTFNMRSGSFVLYKGLWVGNVTTQEKVADGKHIITLDFFVPVQIPNNTKAKITYTSVMGGRQVNLDPDPLVAATGFLADGSLLEAKTVTVVSQISDAIAKPKAKLDSFLMRYPVDSLRQLAENTKNYLHGLEQKTRAVSVAIGSNDRKIQQTIRDLAATTTKVRSQTPDYKKQLKEIQALTAQLNASGLDKKIQGATTQISSVCSLVEGQTVLATADKTIDKLNTQLAKIPENPKYKSLVTDKDKADTIQTKIQKVQTTVRDVYENPEKYRRVNGD